MRLLRVFIFSLFVYSLLACNNKAKVTEKDIRDFIVQASIKADTFLINNNRDTIVFGKEGTGLFFEKNSFSFSDGTEPKGPIKLTLKECLKLSDMVRENLSTISDSQKLTTRGMIYVGAMADGKTLQIKNGKKFIIHFPKDSLEKKQQMCLFYGKQDSSKKVNWNLDKNTLLRPTAYMSGWMHTGFPFDDSTKSGFYFKGTHEDSIFEYFYKHFDNTKLRNTKDILNKEYSVNFKVSTRGKIKNVVIKELDSAFKEKKYNGFVDQYFVEYVKSLPDLEPFYTYGHEVIESDCSFYINTDLFPPDYLKNDSYNKLFNQKYAPFKDKNIQSMNAAEMRYYIFSSTNLGWINCDFFWQNNDEKIEYVLKVEPNTNPNVVMVFKKDKVIIYGKIVGDKCLFANVPINHDVKIVAIKYEGSKPLVSVTDSKIDKEVYDKYDYKEFSLADLQRQLDGKYLSGD